MKRIYLILIFLGFLIGCNNPQKSKDDSGNTTTTDETMGKIDNDSIRIVAKKIIDGEIIWGKNEKYLFPIMDSLINESAESRLFYFKAFGKICEQADGYVSEVVGQYVLKYFEFDPREFIHNSHVLSDKSFKTMGYNAGLEFAMGDYDPDTVIDSLITKTNRKLKDVNDLDKQRLDVFYTQITDGFKSGME
jgi:hypothetical protein